jgi:GNAT superfamily N-acetyltransferase
MDDFLDHLRDLDGVIERHDMDREEFHRRNPHSWRPGWNPADRAKDFDSLPDDSEVWAFHGTDDETADRFLKEGIDTSKKPTTLARERFERGETASFSPGAGLGDGLYVGTDPHNVNGYGRRILGVKVRKGDVVPSPEQASLGVKSAGPAMAVSDAMVRGRIDPDRVIDVSHSMNVPAYDALSKEGRFLEDLDGVIERYAYDPNTHLHEGWSYEDEGDLQDLLGHLREKHPLHLLEAYHDPNHDSIILDRVVVKKGHRKQGIGSSIMKDLTDFADRKKKLMTLQTAGRDVAHDSSWGTTSGGRLVKFYRRFGFERNSRRGRYDLPGNMHRPPQSQVLKLGSSVREVSMDRHSEIPHEIRPDQGDGFKITTPHGFIQYRPTDHANEIWWIESHRRNHGRELMDLMLKHHPHEAVAWGATSSSGEAFRERWHAANPHVLDADEGHRQPFEGQFDPFDHGESEYDEDDFFEEEGEDDLDRHHLSRASAVCQKQFRFADDFESLLHDLDETIERHAEGKSWSYDDEMDLAGLMDRAHGYPEVSEFSVHHDRDKDRLQLNSIRIKRKDQKQGLGSHIMKGLTDFADRKQKSIILALASPKERGFSSTTSTKRLQNFYSRFGFVPGHPDYPLDPELHRVVMHRPFTKKAADPSVERHALNVPVTRHGPEEFGDDRFADPDPDHVYHVTTKKAADSIEREGFRTGRPLMKTRGYGHQPKGTYFTDKDGVGYWAERVENHLAHATDFDEDDDPSNHVAVLKVPRSALNLEPDEVGTEDARSNAWVHRHAYNPYQQMQAAVWHPEHGIHVGSSHPHVIFSAMKQGVDLSDHPDALDGFYHPGSKKFYTRSEASALTGGAFPESSSLGIEGASDVMFEDFGDLDLDHLYEIQTTLQDRGGAVRDEDGEIKSFRGVPKGDRSWNARITRHAEDSCRELQELEAIL